MSVGVIQMNVAVLGEVRMTVGCSVVLREVRMIVSYFR